MEWVPPPPPPFRATGVAPPGRGWRRPPALTSVTAIAPGPPETSTCVGGGGLDGMFARLFSRQVACGTILTASKSQGIHACFCELLFVSGCGWHHVDRLDTSGNRDGVFCKFVCVQARFAPFLPPPNYRESRRSFCKCLPFLNQNRDGIFASVCLRQGAFRPHLYRLGISRNRDCLFARFYHPKITMEMISVASCCLRQGAFGPHLYRLEISKFRDGLLRHSKLLQLMLACVTVRFRCHFYRLEISRFLFF